MENLEIILSFAATALGLLITAITFIMKFLQNEKAKRIAENLIEIGNAVIPYIEQAEKFLNYSGAEKKEFVMTMANRFALDNKIDFDYNEVSKYVEELILLSKRVNARGEDKKSV